MTTKDEKNTSPETPEVEFTNEEKVEEPAPASGEPKKGEDADFHQKELEKLQNQLRKAEHTTVEEKRKRKELARELEEARDSGFDLDEVNRLVEEKLLSFSNQMMSEKIAEAISKSAANDAERQLIEHHLNNSIVRTGNIDEDVRRARILANAARFEKNAQEIAAAQNAGGPASDSAASQGGGDEGDIQLSEADLAMLQRRGITVQEFKKRMKERS